MHTKKTRVYRVILPNRHTRLYVARDAPRECEFFTYPLTSWHRPLPAHCSAQLKQAVSALHQHCRDCIEELALHWRGILIRKIPSVGWTRIEQPLRRTFHDNSELYTIDWEDYRDLGQE